MGGASSRSRSLAQSEGYSVIDDRGGREGAAEGPPLQRIRAITGPLGPKHPRNSGPVLHHHYVSASPIAAPASFERNVWCRCKSWRNTAWRHLRTPVKFNHRWLQAIGLCWAANRRYLDMSTGHFCGGGAALGAYARRVQLRCMRVFCIFKPTLRQLLTGEGAASTAGAGGHGPVHFHHARTLAVLEVMVHADGTRCRTCPASARRCRTKRRCTKNAQRHRQLSCH
jgi:hypothetical protein